MKIDFAVKSRVCGPFRQILGIWLHSGALGIETFAAPISVEGPLSRFTRTGRNQPGASLQSQHSLALRRWNTYCWGKQETMTPRAITLFPRGAGGVWHTPVFARAVKAGGACLMVPPTDMCRTF